MEKSWDKVMGRAVRGLLKIVLEKVGGGFTAGGFKVESAKDINKAVDYVMNIDGFVSIRCPEKGVWLSIGTMNSDWELISDYSDNEICNEIADAFTNWIEK